MPNIVVSTIRGVWFLIFFIIAWRARALTGKNVLAAIAAGFGAAVLGLAAANFLDKNGLSVRFNSGIKMQPCFPFCLLWSAVCAGSPASGGTFGSSSLSWLPWSGSWSS